MLEPFLYGMLTGLFCVGGIVVSLKAFFKVAGDETLDPAAQRKLVIKGILAFVGQFLLAVLAVVFLGKWKLRQGPFVFGLLSMNFLVPLLIHYYSRKKNVD
jgi:hypothetical protein